MKTKLYRQGDVLLKRTKQTNLGKQIAKGKHILAYGEVTGHYHELKGENTTFYDNGNEILVKVGTNNARLIHQEHAQIEIPKGIYQVIIQREFDLVEQISRQVMD